MSNNCHCASIREEDCLYRASCERTTSNADNHFIPILLGYITNMSAHCSVVQEVWHGSFIHEKACLIVSKEQSIDILTHNTLIASTIPSPYRNYLSPSLTTMGHASGE